MDKRKLKKSIKIVLLFLILIILVIVVLSGIKLYKVQKLSNKKYDKEAIKSILNKKLYKDIINVKYSDTINNCVKEDDFVSEYINHYTKINYVKQKYFCENINKLVDKKYTDDEINNIIKNGNNDDVKEFVKKDYIKDVNNYLKYDFAKTKNINRYINYYDETGMDYEKVVLYVNIGLDKEFYTDVKYNNEYKDTVLVNKYSAITKEYKPENLRMIDKNYWNGYDVQQAASVAADAFEQMAKDAEEEGLYILANSSYRSYEDQEKIYNDYRIIYGEAYALNYAAKPGFSEHQTGLVIDIAAKNSNIFANSKEYSWVKENAHKYGFIERYPKDKENITGYKYESWHYRYVGKDIATYIYENDITYDEYYYMFLDK